MKKRFSRNNNSGLLTPSRALSAGLLVVLLVLFGIRSFFPDVFMGLVSPFATGGKLLSAYSAGGDSVRVERDKLLLELEEERAKYASLEAMYADVTGFSPEVSGLLAGVTLRPPVSPYDVLVVSLGRDAGVSAGMVAYTRANVPIGTVEQVSDTSSRILLYSAPERVTLGWVGEGKIPVSLVGRGSGTFVGELSKDGPITIGDGVFIPGPGAQLIGHVVAIDNAPSAPSVTIQIRPLGNPFSVTWVKLR
jgi:cell shape-determining protein MreC